MPDLVPLVDRLAALPQLADIPRPELEWLAANGHLETYQAGAIIAAKGAMVEDLYVCLSGQLVVYMDRGAGRRRVMEQSTGDVSGLLPFSRMTRTPGDVVLEAASELLAIHREHFPEMVYRCPVFTAHTVHLMLDRARTFKTSDLQDEKMIALGKLAAGLAHELNNPASATVRGAKQLRTLMAESGAASRALGSAGLTDAVLTAIEKTRVACLTQADVTVRSPLEQADREDAFADWLVRHQADPAHAGPLADTNVTIEALDALAASAPGATLDAALRWIAVECAAQGLTRDIEEAASRIHDLVAAIKRFTHMDTRAGPQPVDVGVGLRDTVRVLAAKARGKGAAVTLDLPPDLPSARAVGSEINQVWLNLLDNALDALGEGGRVAITASMEHGRIVVRVTDDGPGIPTDVLPRIFDPFFTTKPPGQGTGLGLEITRQLVLQSHGEIAVESRPGRTEFRVSLAAEPGAAVN
jgi:signal transduction histidine kinase